MTREMIDEYLDGALDAAGRAEVERALAQDAAAGRLLAHIKAERALRSAAYDSYRPTVEESTALAGRVMAACEDEALAPVGRIGPTVWVRRVAGVAAVLVIAAGMFAGGRMTAQAQVVTKVETKTEYVAVALDPNSEQPVSEMRQFSSEDTFKEWIRDYQQRQESRTAVAVLPESGWR